MKTINDKILRDVTTYNNKQRINITHINKSSSTSSQRLKSRAYTLNNISVTCQTVKQKKRSTVKASKLKTLKEIGKSNKAFHCSHLMEQNTFFVARSTDYISFSNNFAYEEEAFYPVEALDLIDTTDGCVCVNEMSEHVFTLIPREVCLTQTNFSSNKTKMISAFNDLRGINANNIRSKKRNGISIINGKRVDGKLFCYGVKPNRGGPGLIQTDFSVKNKTISSCFMIKTVRRLEHLATMYMPSTVLRGLSKIEAMNNASHLINNGSTKIWGSLSHTTDYFAPSHTDDDFVTSIFTTFVQDENNHVHDKIHMYFCFPTVGQAIGMRDGDVLLFNPLILHSCSQKESWCDDKTVHLLSCYMKSAVMGGNDNTVELTETEKTNLYNKY